MAHALDTSRRTRGRRVHAGRPPPRDLLNLVAPFRTVPSDLTSPDRPARPALPRPMRSEGAARSLDRPQRLGALGDGLEQRGGRRGARGGGGGELGGARAELRRERLRGLVQRLGGRGRGAAKARREGDRRGGPRAGGGHRRARGRGAARG
eukprot:gene3430-biopygen2716